MRYFLLPWWISHRGNIAMSIWGAIHEERRESIFVAGGALEIFSYQITHVNQPRQIYTHFWSCLCVLLAMTRRFCVMTMIDRIRFRLSGSFINGKEHAIIIEPGCDSRWTQYSMAVSFWQQEYLIIKRMFLLNKNIICNIYQCMASVCMYINISVTVEYGMSDFHTETPWYQCCHTFTEKTDSWAMMIVTTFPLVSLNKQQSGVIFSLMEGEDEGRLSSHGKVLKNRVVWSQNRVKQLPRQILLHNYEEYHGSPMAAPWWQI